MTAVPDISVTATYTSSVHPSKIYYTSAKSRLQVASGTRTSFVHPTIPAWLRTAGTIESADLVMTAVSATPAPDYKMQRHGKPTSGGYAKMTRNNDPAVMSGATLHHGVKVGATWTFDVLDDVVDYLAGDPYYGFLLYSDDATMHEFFGPLAATGRPVLRIVYSSAPTAPTDVWPSGGEVSVPAPWVTWKGGDGMTSGRVQLDTVGSVWNEVTGFATPLFDSGVQVTTVGKINLAAAGYAGLGPGASIAMTVLENNASGPSKWSQPVTWTYLPKPALALTAPGATTGDPTPPHEWTVTPAGQVSAELALTALTTGAKLYSSGLIPGDDLSLTPDKGAAFDGQAVRSTLRIVDRTTRIATLGVPAYTEDTADWTYDHDLAILPFSTFTLSQVGASPKVRIGLGRDDLPDEILVWINGERFARFGFDEYEAGAGWSINSWTIPPNQQAEVTVIPMVNNVAGKPRTKTITTEVDGFWLADPITDASVSFWGTELSEQQGSSTAIYTPSGGGRVIVRTLSLRGTEGSMDGEIWDYESETAAEQAAQFEALRLLAPTRELRVIHGRQNFEASVVNMSMVDHQESMLTTQDVRKVHAEFYQSDFDDGGLFSGAL